MAVTKRKIKVEDIEIEGKFSFISEVDRTKKPPILKISGVIETTARLPDSFKKLEGGRAIVYNVLLNSESVGSDDDKIVYGFSATNYDIKD